jgi:hypothetical protein
MSLTIDNESLMQIEDEDNYLCQIFHEKRLDDFLVEPDFSLENLEVNSEKKQSNSDVGNKKKKGPAKNQSDDYVASENFIPFQHKYPPHTATPTLPNEFQNITPSPYSIFRLFFSENQLQIIVKNTNLYAYRKNVEELNNKKCKELTINELKIWLALVIYMGIFKLPATKDYWTINNYYPSHEITKYMTFVRFNQVIKF